MKRIFLSLTVLSLTYTWIYHTASTAEKIQQINPVIGDVSFVKKFGYYPDATINEDLRIKTHLEYVERVLRKKETGNLPPDVRLKRTEVLNHLNNYYKAGIFPQTETQSGQPQPCFIDKNGRICATGYLIEKTTGREVAENIDSKCRYEKLSAMNNKMVIDWIAAVGLTKEEFAMIQPAFSNQ